LLRDGGDSFGSGCATVAQGDAPVIASQYNANVNNQLAANAPFGAGFGQMGNVEPNQWESVIELRSFDALPSQEHHGRAADIVCRRVSGRSWSAASRVG
jgi:hypothetical protein